LEIAPPGSCRYTPAFHPASTGMLRPPLSGDQVVQVRQPRQKRLGTAAWMMKRFPHPALPVDGMMGLIQQGAGDRHLRVCEPRPPPRLLLLDPAPDALPGGHPCAGRHVVGTVASPLAERHHPSALPQWCAVQPGVELRAHGVADRGGDGGQWPGGLGHRMAEAVAQARSLQARAQTLVVRSTPAVRLPRPRYDGSCGDAACWNARYDWVKAAALASVV